jgi:hypothetical protein
MASSARSRILTERKRIDQPLSGRGAVYKPFESRLGQSDQWVDFFRQDGITIGDFQNDKYMPAPTFEDVQGNVQGPSAPATKTVGTPVLAMDDIS